MPEQKQKQKKKRKSNFKLGKETYGDMPIEECFRKALEPYFNPEEGKEIYLDRLG